MRMDEISLKPFRVQDVVEPQDRAFAGLSANAKDQNDLARTGKKEVLKVCTSRQY